MVHLIKFCLLLLLLSGGSVGYSMGDGEERSPQFHMAVSFVWEHDQSKELGLKKVFGVSIPNTLPTALLDFMKQTLGRSYIKGWIDGALSMLESHSTFDDLSPQMVQLYLGNTRIEAVSADNFKSIDGAQ